MINRILSSSILLAAGVMFSNQSIAEEIRGKQICEKFKACTLKTLDEQDLPEQMKQMVIAQLDQCETSFGEKEEALAAAGLVDQANACADEMVAMPCEKLMTPDAANNSKACKSFQDAAKKAGIEE